MNASLKAVAAAEASRATLFHLRAALFHSTPVLERRRRNHWQPRSTSTRRSRKNQWKPHVLRNFNTHAEDFFQCWIPFLEHEDLNNRGPSWFRPDQGGNGSRRQGSPNHGKTRRTRGFEFCDDDDDIDSEAIFRAAFGGERISFWSFMQEDNAHQWRSSSGYTNGHRGRSWHTRFNSESDEDSSSDSDSSESTSASDRLALGLSPHGPLKLDTIKHAYRTCALKYHPDRHQGPSKNAAEEKFKLCTAAYQSLCEKFTVNQTSI